MFVCVKQAHERFEEPKLEAVRDNNVELVQDILKDLTPLSQECQNAHELACILREPHFQVLRQALSIYVNIPSCLETGLPAIFSYWSTVAAGNA